MFLQSSRRYNSYLAKSSIVCIKSKKDFQEVLKTNSLAKELWNPVAVETKEGLNAPNTLPMEFKTRKLLFQQVQLENPNKNGIPLQMKQFWEFGKSFLTFYKSGLSNVWNNRKISSQLVKSYRITNKLDKKGNDRDIRITNFTALTNELSSLLFLHEVEGTKKTPTKSLISESIFSINRAEYQTILRTSKDLPKLPLFALLFLVFEEATPIICFLFPEITPSTCVLPFMIPRLHASSLKSAEKLAEYRTIHYGENLEQLAHKTPYNLSREELNLVTTSVRLTSKYIPVSLYPESTLRCKLLNYYNYIKVDNYLIATNGGVWNLSPSELTKAAQERGLISWKSKDEPLAIDHLRLQLYLFLVNFPKYNIGYLGVNHLANLVQDDLTEILSSIAQPK